MESFSSSSQPQSSSRALGHLQTEYQYKDLNPEKNEIRLLQILPKRPGSEANSRVECSLFITSLDNAPKYQALSYAWDDPAERPIVGDILLEGYPFKVTPGLEHALYQLRSDSMQLFWIDALCINQKHDLERNEQVAKMRTIYERAENVAIWLGSSSVGLSSAFSLFETIYERRLHKRLVADILQDKTNTKSLEEILKLYKRPYWARLWVVQEVKSAKKATVMWAEDPTLFDLSLQIKFGGVKAMELPKNTVSNFPDINALLSNFWNKLTSDPRDMIYALVGLSSARDDSRFVFDYSASVRRVYINVVKYVLASSKKLDIICSIMHGSNKFGLPSWVPDWTVGSFQFGSPLMGILSSEGAEYCSAGSTTAGYELEEDDQIINVKGFLLSPIHLVGLKGTMVCETDFRTGIPILLSWFKLLNVIELPQSIELETFLRTIFFDRFSPKDYTYPTEFELMERLFGAISLLAEAFCPEEKIDPYMLHLREKYRIKQWWAKSWFSSALYTNTHRRFFVTDTDLIGISAMNDYNHGE